MNSRVLCQGCRCFREAQEMRKVGLGYICDDKCMDLVRQRAREKRARREATRTKSRGALDSNRRKVRARDGRCCRWCGRTSCLQVHHIRYRSEGGGHEMSNLITLCEFHHREVHSRKRVWQPVLLAVIAKQDEGVFVTVPEMARQMGCL